MARSSSGKWVSRAAATGGGRTYRGQVPVNWYAALILIVVLGLGSVVFSRYEYQNPSSSTSTVPPVVGTTWFAGYAFDVCGTQLTPLPSNAGGTTATKAFFTSGNGVITVSPRTAGQAGTNATLGRFVAGYPGMKVTADGLRIPNGTAFRTYQNGQRCAPGTPDAGQAANVVVDYWPSAFAKTKAKRVEGDPGSLRFSANQLISIGFVPPGTTLPKPNGAVVTALLQAQAGTTTTTAPASTPTSTVPAPTTTSPPSITTTTRPSNTTTTKAR